MNKWKKIKSHRVHKNPWFSIYQDDVFRPDGSKAKYFYLTTDNLGIVIIPFDGKKIYLVNQYRYTLQKRSWELVAGRAESNNHLAEAKRELLEETGFKARQWKYLGEFLCGPGHTNHLGKVYLAQGLIKGGYQRERGESDMIMKGFTLKQLDQMIKTGQLKDSWSIVPLYFLKQYLK